MNKKIGLIGFGYWGQKVYQTLKLIFKETNIFVVDPYYRGDCSKIQLINTKELLNNSAITDVLIVTPEETHFQIARECLNSGKNIFVEKPLCLKYEEAKELINLAQNNRLKIYVDYTFLFDPYVKKIKEAIDEKKIGELTHIESIRHSININKPKVTVFDDLATHDLYLGRFFYGQNPTSIQKVSLRINSPQINQGRILLSYSKKTLSGQYSWVQPSAHRQMIFFGTTGTLVWDRTETEILHYKNHTLLEKIKIDRSSSPLFDSISHFLNQKQKINHSSYLEDVMNLEKLDQAQ